MRILLLLASLLVAPSLSHAGSLYQTFRDGILGIPWGATLDHVISVYPDGDNVFATTAGHRSYWVKDGATFLGVPRDQQGVQYGFDAENRVGIVAVAFAYERKEELRGVLISLLGPPRETRDPHHSNTAIYMWPSDSGMRVSLSEVGEGRKAIVWLAVAAPGYKYEDYRKCASVGR